MNFKTLRISCCIILSMQVINLHAQVRAVTDAGDEVILYPDGSWEYLAKFSEDSLVLENPKEFTKNKEAVFLLKSKKINVGFFLNPKKWTFKKAVGNPDAEYEIQMKDNDIYGMIITEEIEIPLLTLRDIALSNAMSVAPDMKIVHQEYRIVNGIKVLALKMSGTMKGIKFTYYGYYYSNLNGTVQFITYSSQSVMDKNTEECESFLNGITLYEK